MARVERSIVIEAAPQRVWDTITDPHLAPQWNSNILEVRDISVMPVRTGTSWTQVVRLLGKPTPMSARIADCDPPWRGVVQLEGPGAARVTTIIEPVGGGSRVTQIMDLTLPGGLAGRIASRLAQATVERELEDSLRRQKAALESPDVAARAPTHRQ